jgi:hypothetical protein
MFTRMKTTRAKHRSDERRPGGLRHVVRTRVFVSSAAVLLAVGSASSASAAIIATDDPTAQEQLAEQIVADAGGADRQWDDVDTMTSILPEKAEADSESAQSDPAEVPVEEETTEEESSDDSGSSVDISAECSDYSGNQAIGCTMTLDYGWDMGEFQCLVDLWNRESGWDENAYNSSSGATGIPQALPGSKMASAGDDWATNPATQIEWGLGYIDGVYGSPCAAWSHSESVGWY